MLAVLLLAPEPDDLIFAQRQGAFDAQAVRPFPSEIPLDDVVQRQSQEHRNQRAEAGKPHVFMRIPNVSLGPQVGDSQFPAKNFGHHQHVFQQPALAGENVEGEVGALGQKGEQQQRQVAAVGDGGERGYDGSFPFGARSAGARRSMKRLSLLPGR